MKRQAAEDRGRSAVKRRTSRFATVFTLKKRRKSPKTRDAEKKREGQVGTCVVQTGDVGSF